MVAWFGIPLLLRKYGLYSMSELTVVLWLVIAVIFAITQHALASFRISQHLENNYPTKYKEMQDYKKYSIRLRDISSRFDIIFQFAPENDQKYSNLKRNYKESSFFMYLSVVYGFIASWCL